ncbi:hypothetical protein HK098_003223 [Nowakowskiella sp. JEL0407]|nr:hypothetical protein HK098_003223 [Nowakowskiella sp. JEL0407]
MHITAGRNDRGLEIWEDSTHEGMKIDDVKAKGLSTYFNIPMLKGDRTTAYEQFDRMRLQNPKSIVPYIGWMLAIGFSSHGLENLKQFDNSGANLYVKISLDIQSFWLIGSEPLSIILSSNKDFNGKDRFELCFELWLLDPLSSISQSTFVRSLIAITRMNVSPDYTFRLTALFETQPFAELDHQVFTYSLYFAPALINSFQVDTVADLVERITEYYSKNLCLVTRTEIFSRLAGSFAILRDLYSMRHMLYLLEPYEENLRIDDAHLVSKAPMSSIDARVKKNSSDEYSTTIPQSIETSTTFAVHLIEQLVEFQLYDHVKTVLGVYRKAGLKIFDTRLDKFKKVFVVNKKGELSNQHISLAVVLIASILIGSSTASPVAKLSNNTLEKRGAINWHPQLWANGCDWTGNDITSVVTTADQCGPKCEQTNGCTHYAWSKYQSKCWLKSGTVYREDAISVADQTTVCGFLGRAQFADRNEAASCDWIGQDVGSIAAREYQECFGYCSYEAYGCTHFTWTSANGGTCWLKNGDANPKYAYLTRDGSMHCAFT